MSNMLGKIRPCPMCGRHGTDTPHGNYHTVLKRGKRKTERFKALKDQENT